MSEVEPFSAFMARALYEPGRGYYARNVRTVGARGDFSTSATLSTMLGGAVARWLGSEAWRQPRVRALIEIGAGDGSLLAAIRDARGFWARRLALHVVETSPVLRARQAERLGDGVVWHEDLGEALRAVGGRAFLVHNELLDAFPVDLAQWTGGAWREVWVGGRPAREELRPLTLDPASFSALSGWTPPYAEQRVELHGAVRRWLRGWAPAWRGGAMLSIDYGDVMPALYHRRPRGTLRAYWLQQRLEGASVYASPGQQDITADVNFTDYRAWARELGWREVWFGTQAELIARWGKVEGDADRFLVDPDGAGGAFKAVLHRPT
ncbi:MAG TPA: SAM-dependent methyltransferase [Myxococcota bacterium]|nr:SAM-dependent methyltransferase [Myxococcota bacterium]